MTGPCFHNVHLQRLLPAGDYGLGDVERIERALRVHGTLEFESLRTGVFPAAAHADAAAGYANAWLRDNVYVAMAHHECGRSAVAARVANAFYDYFWKYRARFEAIISGAADANDAMRRPHVRFDGNRLEELRDQHWSHAQNDALGYSLWFLCALTRQRVLNLGPRAVATLSLFANYFSAIRFWQDEDSGHWEETRHRSASSIGTVVAGLRELHALVEERADEFSVFGGDGRLGDTTANLMQQGAAALAAILPSECVQDERLKRRRYDAALVFLVEPLNVVTPAMADTIVADVQQHLLGKVGIRRYLGDSYWAPNYDELLPAAERTRDFSEDVEARNRLLDRVGNEAQWCIFDPILSRHFGRRYSAARAPQDRERQRWHFERALSQVTAEWRCPELYYLKHGAYIANPHTPLLWTQANLKMALAAMRSTASM